MEPRLCTPNSSTAPGGDCRSPKCALSRRGRTGGAVGSALPSSKLGDPLGDPRTSTPRVQVGAAPISHGVDVPRTRVCLHKPPPGVCATLKGTAETRGGHCKRPLTSPRPHLPSVCEVCRRSPGRSPGNADSLSPWPLSGAETRPRGLARGRESHKR